MTKLYTETNPKGIYHAQFFPNRSYKLILILILILISQAACNKKNYKSFDYANKLNDKTLLARLVKSTHTKKNQDLGGFRLIHNGLEAHAAIQFMISNAQQSLELQYWSLHQDNTGKIIMHQLLEAADRGVKIRILLDDFFAQGGNANLSTLDKHPNIKVRLYNPISNSQWLRIIGALLKFNRANRRMHNKILIADNVLAIVGGRNIGDAYYYYKQRYFYKDLDVLTIGNSVDKLADSFDLYWNAKWAVPLSRTTKMLLLPIEYTSTKNSLNKHFLKFIKTEYWQNIQSIKPAIWLQQHNKEFVWASFQVLHDPPNKVRGIKKSNKQFLEYKMTKQMMQAKNNVKIITPYFVPQGFGLRWIKKLNKKKIPVYLLTNSFAANDSSISHGGYQRYRIKLLQYGVKLYEFKPNALVANKKSMTWFRKKPDSRLHAKSVIIDDRITYIGSVNLTPRSRYLNTEICIKINSSRFAKQLSELFTLLSNNSNSYQVILKNPSQSIKDYEPDDTGIDDYEPEIQWLSESGGKQTKIERDPNVTMLKHFIISFLSLLPIEDLL